MIFDNLYLLMSYRRRMNEETRKGHVSLRDTWARLASDRENALVTIAEMLDNDRRFEIVADLTAIIKSARRHFRAIDGPEIVLHYIANLDRKDGTTPRQRKIYNLTEANRQRLIEKAEAIAAGLKGWRFIEV